MIEAIMVARSQGNRPGRPDHPRQKMKAVGNGKLKKAHHD